MRRFAYKAKDSQKQLLEGVLEAETEQEALSHLSQMGYFPLSIRREDESTGGQRESVLPLRFRKLRRQEVTFFTRQLADLLEAGLPLLRALTVLQEQTESRRLAEVLSAISALVRDGRSLSEALALYPHVFSNLYVSMVRSGEVGGILPGVLARLAEFAEKEDELRAKIRSALAYPILILLVGIVTIAVLLIFVVPKLLTLFQDMGQVLPLPTRILIGVSQWVAGYWWGIVLVFVLGAVVLQKGGLSRGSRLALDRVKLSLPIWGPLIQKVEIASFARSLGTLLHHGVPILQAMQVVVQATGNSLLRADLELIGEQLKGGTTLSQGLRGGGHFPSLVVHMVAVGEEAGTLDRSLAKIADTYEREADRMMKLLTSLVEPVMILVMGSLVGFIVVSMLLPIFQIDLLAR